jgi:hypothetical protein
LWSKKTYTEAKESENRRIGDQGSENHVIPGTTAGLYYGEKPEAIYIRVNFSSLLWRKNRGELYKGQLQFFIYGEKTKASYIRVNFRSMLWGKTRGELYFGCKLQTFIMGKTRRRGRGGKNTVLFLPLPVGPGMTGRGAAALPYATTLFPALQT